MKKNIKHIFILLTISLIITSCERQPLPFKIYKFKVKYQLGSIDTLTYESYGDNTFYLEQGDLKCLMSRGRVLACGVRSYEILEITNKQSIK